MESGLERSYRYCRSLHRRHGRTYYLATRLLPAAKRPHIHALYGFARYADEIVDQSGDRSAADQARRWRDWSQRFLAGLNGQWVQDPVLPAVLHTIALYRLDRADFAAFLRSMEMDLTVTGYPDYAALLSYMEGSAAAIGTMTLPILGPADPLVAREPARQLGLAFQLTNFIRDVAEDLTLGRVYLPERDLARFGVTRTDLIEATRCRRSTVAIRELIGFEIDRARRHYKAAAPGIAMLAPSSRPCIRTAFNVYGAILDEIEAAGNEVLARRIVVPRRRRIGLLARSMIDLAPDTAPSRVNDAGVALEGR